MKRTFLACIFFALPFLVFSQDIITKNDGTEFPCTVLKIEKGMIYFLEINSESQQEFSIAVDRVKQLKYADNRVINNHDLLVLASEDIKHHVIKVGFFSPLIGRSVIGYEYIRNASVSLETEIGIVGAGKQDVLYSDQRGLWLQAGFKWHPGKGKRQGGTGIYLRPEIGYEIHKGQQVSEAIEQSTKKLSPPVDYSLNCVNALINIGRQWMLADHFTVDVFAGYGLGSARIRTSGSEFTEGPYAPHPQTFLMYGHSNGDLNVVVKGGFKLGYAF